MSPFEKYVRMLKGKSVDFVPRTPIFNDGAILQCELPVNIWGNASPGNTVDVFLNALNPQVILYIADNEYYT